MASSPRILVVCSLTFLLLSGCSNRVENMANTIETTLFGHQGVELSTERVNAYPYAAAYIKTDDFPQAIAVLDRVSGDQRVYRTGGDEAITTRYGRVIGSSGVPGMPLFTENAAADPLKCHVVQQFRGSRELCPSNWERIVEVGNYGANKVQQWKLTSTTRVVGNSSYTHPDGTELEVAVIEEQGRADSNEFKNTFYAANGRVVYAHHWVSPQLGYVTWREMKPYSGDLPQQQGGNGQ
ncbi:hypothetical protein CWE21_10945 [Pseudidiomarina aquimaris]|uniref:YjbF family lipoprotein n=2 Tax=Pseudidiomarina aquimaris TaxID=641841 RepID=A0A432XD29_9GAMM|nr:hypothetical protein CWE21_10945 [Pseudidiomarina aquimaris]